LAGPFDAPPLPLSSAGPLLTHRARATIDAGGTKLDRALPVCRTSAGEEARGVIIWIVGSSNDDDNSRGRDENDSNDSATAVRDCHYLGPMHLLDKASYFALTMSSGSGAAMNSGLDHSRLGLKVHEEASLSWILQGSTRDS